MRKENLIGREQAYRSNISLITLRRSEFLLVNLVEWPHNYWKFPQGGVNPGETLEKAARREFQEELGSDKISILRRSKISRKYTWNKPKSIGGKSYIGQNQTFFIVKFLGDDSDIVVKSGEIRAFCWQTAHGLKDLIDRKELDFRGYWRTIRSILQEQHDALSLYGIDTNEIV